MNSRITGGWLVLASLLAAPMAMAQGQAPPPAAGGAPAMQPAPEAPDAWGDDLFAWLDDEEGMTPDLAWLGDEEPPAMGEVGTGGPGPGTRPGMGRGMGMGPRMGAGPGMGGPGAMGPGFGPGVGRGMGPGMRRGPGARVLAQLDLSDAQREKLADLHERQMRADIQARADIETAMLDLRKLLRADRPDRVAIDRQIDKLSSLRAGQQKARLGTMLDARGVLTPEQQKKARELRARGPFGPRGGVTPGPRRRADDTRDLEAPKR